MPCPPPHHTLTPAPALRLRQYFNDPDTIRPTLTGYSLEKFGKGVRSVCCVLNPETGNTNTLVGGGDGTVSFVNQSLNKVCFPRRVGGREGGWALQETAGRCRSSRKRAVRSVVETAVCSPSPSPPPRSRLV